jgi:hypothetical protein
VPNFVTRPAARRPQSAPVPARRSPPWTLIGWGAIAALVGLLLIVGVVARQRVVALIPAAAPLYAAIGLPAGPPGAGLELRAVNSAMLSANGAPNLVVSGDIVNNSSAVIQLPPLMVSLRDKQNQIIKTWRFNADRQQLPPGDMIPFQTSLQSPPSAAASAVVTFAN